MKSARELACELAQQVLGTLPGRCTDEEEPDDVHSITCDRLAAAIEADGAAVRAQERVAVLDEVSYRWEKRNEVGKPFSDWLWEWVNEARRALAAQGESERKETSR